MLCFFSVLDNCLYFIILLTMIKLWLKELPLLEMDIGYGDVPVNLRISVSCLCVETQLSYGSEMNESSSALIASMSRVSQLLLLQWRLVAILIRGTNSNNSPPVVSQVLEGSLLWKFSAVWCTTVTQRAVCNLSLYLIHPIYTVAYLRAQDVACCHIHPAACRGFGWK